MVGGRAVPRSARSRVVARMPRAAQRKRTRAAAARGLRRRACRTRRARRARAHALRAPSHARSFTGIPGLRFADDRAARKPGLALPMPSLADLRRTLGLRAGLPFADGYEAARRLVQSAGWRLRIALRPRLRQRHHPLARRHRAPPRLVTLASDVAERRTRAALSGA